MGILQFNSEKVAPIASRFDNVQRTVFTDGVGKNITSAGNLAQALELSGLNYKVEKFPVQFTQPVVQMMGDKQIVVQTPYAIKDKVATVRTDTMQSLGIVSPNYEILNNGLSELNREFLNLVVESRQLKSLSKIASRSNVFADTISENSALNIVKTRSDRSDFLTIELKNTHNISFLRLSSPAFYFC